MSRIQWLVPGVAAAVALGLPALAQEPPRLEVTPFVGGTFFLSDPPGRFALGRHGGEWMVEEGRFDDALTMGAFAALRAGDHFGVEGMFAWIPTQLAASRGMRTESVDVNGYMYGANLVYYLPFAEIVEPYLTAGVGGETYDYELEGVATHSDFMVDLGGGISHPLSDRIALRLDLRDCVTWFDPGIDERRTRVQNDLMAVAGLKFQFPLRSP